MWGPGRGAGHRRSPSGGGPAHLVFISQSAYHRAQILFSTLAEKRPDTGWVSITPAAQLLCPLKCTSKTAFRGRPSLKHSGAEEEQLGGRPSWKPSSRERATRHRGGLRREQEAAEQAECKGAERRRRRRSRRGLAPPRPEEHGWPNTRCGFKKEPKWSRLGPGTRRPFLCATNSA